MVKSHLCLLSKRIHPIGIFAGTIDRQHPPPVLTPGKNFRMPSRLSGMAYTGLANLKPFVRHVVCIVLVSLKMRRQYDGDRTRSTREASARLTFKADAISCLSAVVLRPSRLQHSSTASAFSSAMPRPVLLPTELSVEEGGRAVCRRFGVFSRYSGSRDLVHCHLGMMQRR